MAEKDKFAPYPEAVRDSVLQHAYDKAKFTAQSLRQLGREAVLMKAYYKDVIDAFERAGGRVEAGEGENESVISVGGTSLVLEQDPASKRIAYIGLHMDLAEKPAIPMPDLDLILQALHAYTFRESPDKTAALLERKARELWSAGMVRGVHELGRRIREDTLLTSSAVSGANIEEMEEPLPEGVPDLRELDRQTEYDRRG
ncbi:MAG: hypothetical protein LBG62_00055 [Candidatus Methanoplasma sp.]|jgi:hypothetical protein|nr:hypothetical protein [Candidatus Methanoplasma sp.]